MPETYQSRLERISKAINREKPDRVPIVLKMCSWASQYYGISSEEFYKNPEIVTEVYLKLSEEFPYDGQYNYNNATAFAATAALGGGLYRTDEKSGIQISNKESQIMGPEIYDIILNEGYIECLRDYVLPHKYTALAQGSTDKAFEALKTSYLEYGKYMGRVVKSWSEIEEKSGRPTMWGKGAILNPFDIIMDYFRDFSGIVVDMRRNPKKLLEACDIVQKHMVQTSFSKFKSHDDGFGVCWPTHMACFLKPKDFEKFYYPYFSESINYCVDHKVYLSLILEGNWEHLYDSLQDLPKSKYLIADAEKDDYKKLKKALGDKMCLTGGITVNTLRYGTTQECADAVKKLIDDCADPDGGFIVGTDALLSLGEAKPENLKAIIETTKEYGKC